MNEKKLKQIQYNNHKENKKDLNEMEIEGEDTVNIQKVGTF